MSSKYDFVKVKVLIEGDHYYVLSRYLLSRMLTFSEVPSLKANTIALELKKDLVDGSMLEVPQQEMQEQLFKLMAQHGFGNHHARLFRTMTQFYTERVPLVVLIAGSGCTGKSSIAHALGSRLNNQHIIDCEVMMNALAAASGDPLDDPLWFLDSTAEELVIEWERRCSRVAVAVAGEVEKALSEGKVLILEGSLLNIALYSPYVKKAMRNSGIFLSVLVEAPAKRHRNIMVEGWLGSRSHFASHLSIPQQHAMVLERFEEISTHHNAQIAAMTGPASTTATPTVPQAEDAKAPTTSPRRTANINNGGVVRVQFEPDAVSEIVNELHTELLHQIIPLLKHSVESPTIGEKVETGF